VLGDTPPPPADRIPKDCDRNKWLDEKEMLEYGLVDAVLETHADHEGHEAAG
jgi:ATP-dependent protease ClpP protease subunit